jgi:two-component system response regulator AtoC
MSCVLIVDDDASASALRDVLASEGHRCMLVNSLQQGQLHMSLQAPDWAIVGDRLPDGSGMAMLDAARRTVQSGGKASAAIILLSAQPSLKAAVAAFRSGAADYLERPPDLRHLKALLASRPAQGRSDAPLTAASFQAASLLGESDAMRRLREHIARVAPTEASVLLLGESGTGKELVAQNIHAQSARQRHAFLPVNCGAISPQLIESEIFGHEKGSFTGADRQHKGYFERASGGTLFLDEVIEMPIELQVKLLRVLETGSFMRIGSNQELQTDVRIVAATNRDPEEAIVGGKLRLDLYHRLNVFPLKIPALRERGDDVALLAQYFLDEFNCVHGTGKVLSSRALSVLGTYHWPGNVRELRNFIQRAYILSDQQIDAHALEPGPAQCTATALTLAIPVGTSLADVDRRLIFATLDLCGGVKKRAANLLGISLKTLYNRLEEYANQDRALALGSLVVGDVATDAAVALALNAAVAVDAGRPVTIAGIGLLN